jgi:pyruvate,water dikinase
MSAHSSLILPFSKIDKDDVSLVGGKGANLGEMTKLGLPVPQGFCITVRAYDLFLRENNLETYIYGVLKNIKYESIKDLENSATQIQKKILNSEIPEEIYREVTKYYLKLSRSFRKILVAVRSSATAEDMPGTSFAGQQITFLNVKGEANLLNNVRKCWASLFTPRSIYYRYINKIKHEKVKISVIVQLMVQSKASGVIFSLDPVTNAKDRVVIEAVWGLGEMIVQGSVIPDKYVVQKGTNSILSKEISDQQRQLIKVGTENQEVKVLSKLVSKQKISDEEIIKLAKIAQKLQEHYYFPQDTEWAKDNRNLYIVQTRPVTTMNLKFVNKGQGFNKKDLFFSEMPILTGSPASPGLVSGRVKIIKNARQINKIEQGNILVAPMTSPDFVPAMKKSAAIITDQGGQTSHAAIVSRELGIPCIVGTKEATSKLTDGVLVNVDGEKGQVFIGNSVKVERNIKQETINKKIQTATKVYVNLAEPERAREISRLDVDGVGLLRAEFMIANIGIHPKEAIKQKQQNKFVEKLANDISVFCHYFSPRLVVYRATDFKTNEYRSLPGGRYWEPEEPNPMLGFRGAFRYIANPEVFTLELKALKKVREKYKNLSLMIPYVRSPEELAKVRRIISTENLFEEKTFKFWMMVELPVNVILLEDFIKVGIDGVSIGSNDLTMLLLGTDRDNSDVSTAFDERSPAAMWALKRIIKICNKNGITSSICGQAPSMYEDFVEKLINYGITSISVNPDAIARVKNVIVESEKKLVLERQDKNAQNI